MKDDYKVIVEFICCGKSMVTIAIGNAAHVMSQEEWHKIYGREHQNRWNIKVDWNRLRSREKYNREKNCEILYRYDFTNQNRKLE